MSEIPYVHNPLIHNTNAARELVPIIMDWFSPGSVIDIGCGTGTWLAVFEENNVHDFIGVDGAYVDRSMLKIPLDRFVSMDLEFPFSYPRRFDLAVSLEVAEHLPEENSEMFVAALTSLSDVILFSAAVPGQGGQNHTNEQWPQYWQEKFSQKGYRFYDDIRPIIWWNKNIDWWYRQNIFLVIKETYNYNQRKPNGILAAIHPEMHLFYKNIYDRKILRLESIEKEYKKIISGQGEIKRSLGIFFRTVKNFISK